MAAPPRRVFALPITPHGRPIEDRFDPPPQPARRLGLRLSRSAPRPSSRARHRPPAPARSRRPGPRNCSACCATGPDASRSASPPCALRYRRRRMRRRSSPWPHRASSGRAAPSAPRSGRSRRDAFCGIPPRVCVPRRGDRVDRPQAHLAGPPVEHEAEDPRLRPAGAHLEIQPATIVVHSFLRGDAHLDRGEPVRRTSHDLSFDPTYNLREIVYHRLPLLSTSSTHESTHKSFLDGDGLWWTALEQRRQQATLFQLLDRPISTHVDPGGVRSGGHPLRQFCDSASTVLRGARG